MGENHQHLVDQHTTQTQVEDKSRYATTTTTTLHQSKHKYKYTMKITGLIASTLMLLLVLMASKASGRSIGFPEPQYCCNAISARCEACKAGVSVEEICRRNPHHQVCPQKPTKPSHPHNCYSKIWNTEIRHGEMGANGCCWYGDWKSKSKCQKKTTHRDNCYSTILNKEVMHGEMGAKKCCWKGDWKRKSKCTTS